jgi:hypothetical protein
MNGTIERCRAILAAAKTSNDNKMDFRFARQSRVDELLAQLNAKKPYGHVYNSDEARVA